MTTIDERIATQQAKVAALTAGRTPTTSAEGARMNRIAAQPTGPIDFGSPELNQQAADSQALLDAQVAAARTFPDAASAKKAAEVLTENADVWDADRLEKGWSRVKTFVSENPDAVKQFAQESTLDKWKTTTIETSPMPSTFEARRRKLEDPLARVIIPKRRLEDLSPDSRERVMAEEEKGGLDTVSGFGDNVIDVMHAAVQFDSPRMKRLFMEAAVRDDIEEAGIELPEGAEVVGLNENLQEVQFLKPTEDGKLRWTLANSEVVRMQDIGVIADPSELLSALGSVAGTVLTKSRIAGEFAGDIVGRNIGLAIEYALSNGEVTPEDMQAAVMGTPFESAFETIASRVLGRIIDTPARRRRVLAEGDNATRAQENIAETADAVEIVNDITGKRLQVTPAEAANIEKALIEQRSKEKNLPAKKRQGLEAERFANQRVLSEATDKALGPTATSPNYDPYTAVENVSNTVADAHRRAAISDEVIIPTTHQIEDGVEVRTFAFADDVSAGSLNAGPEFDQGVRVFVDHDTQSLVVKDVFAGAKSQGQTLALLDRAWADTAQLGYRMGTDKSVSASAQKMMTRLEGLGWSFSRNPAAKTDPRTGNIFTEDGSPAFFVEGAPGEVVLTKEFREDAFDRMAIEGELESFEQMLPAAQELANDANTSLLNILGWRKQARHSNYTLDNPSSTGLRQQIRAVQNRLNTSLTGVEAAEADKVLRAATRREVDDEGNEFLAGLANEQLDFANVLSARDRLSRIALETEDPDVVGIVRTLDNLINNSTARTLKGNPIAQSTRSNITNAIAASRTAQGFVTEASNIINSSRLFQKNRNGEFLYTNLKDWDSLMAGGARFIKNLKPLIDGSPTLKRESAAVLRELYRDKVFTDGRWSRTKHESFMGRYSESLEVVFEADDLAALARFDLTGNGKGVWDRLVAKQTARAARASAFVGKADAVVDPIKINPRAIIESISKQPFGRTAAYMRWVAKNDPKQFAQLQDAAKEQIRSRLQTKYFDPEVAGPQTRAKANQLTVWLNENERVIRDVLGEEYWAGIRATVRANDVTTRGFRIKGTADETQTIITRAFRSLIGPLTKPQRQLTAVQFARTRIAARKALRMLSSPEAIRDIGVAAKNGVTVESQAGIALMSRLGLWSEFGIVGDPADPAYQAAAMEIWQQLKEDTIGEEVEQEQP